MADGAHRRIALLSIHPRHADALLSGHKRVELRRIPINPSTSHVLIYATSPVQAVIGWFEVAGVDAGSRTEIWNAHHRVCGVTRREFRTYFAGSDRAYAIRVAGAHRLIDPLSLSSIPGVKRPPQSFQYVDPQAAAWIFSVPRHDHPIAIAG